MSAMAHTIPERGTVPCDVYLAVIGELREVTLRYEAERDRRLTEHFAHIRELRMLQREADQLAVEKALTSADALADKHNDLIRAGEKKDETYATKSELTAVEKMFAESVGRIVQWQSKLTGGMIILAFIGIGNLVKLWLT